VRPWLEPSKGFAKSSDTKSSTGFAASRPARAGIDPWRKLIEREREDNVVEIKAVEAGGAQ